MNRNSGAVLVLMNVLNILGLWEYNFLFCQLCESNCVALYWVLGHSSIQENEVADQLAGNGSSIQFIGPEPAIGISSNLIRSTVFDIFRRKQYLNWLSNKGQRQAKELNQSCLSARNKEYF